MLMVRYISATSVNTVMFLNVDAAISCPPRVSSATVMAEAIDESKHPSVLATVAGDNTILVVPAAGVNAPALREELSRHLLEGAA